MTPLESTDYHRSRNRPIPNKSIHANVLHERKVNNSSPHQILRHPAKGFHSSVLVLLTLRHLTTLSPSNTRSHSSSPSSSSQQSLSLRLLSLSLSLSSSLSLHCALSLASNPSLTHLSLLLNSVADQTLGLALSSSDSALHLLGKQGGERAGGDAHRRRDADSADTRNENARSGSSSSSSTASTNETRRPVLIERWRGGESTHGS